MVTAMKVTKIKGVLASVLIAGLVVGVGTGASQEKKQAALNVTLEELAKDPAMYQGKLVQVEGVIQQTQILKEKQGEFDYRLAVGKNDFLLAWCAGKLAVSEGDTARITGEFRHNTAAANPFQILAGSKNGKVEKTTLKKPESTPPAGATDLKMLDRTIGKEPKYSSRPNYALLVFGPEAKTRVWLILVGQVLYVDRNGNGDLRLFRVERIVVIRDGARIRKHKSQEEKARGLGSRVARHGLTRAGQGRLHQDQPPEPIVRYSLSWGIVSICSPDCSKYTIRFSRMSHKKARLNEPGFGCFVYTNPPYHRPHPSSFSPPSASRRARRKATVPIGNLVRPPRLPTLTLSKLLW